MKNIKADCGLLCTAILVKRSGTMGTVVEILDEKYLTGIRFRM